VERDTLSPKLKSDSAPSTSAADSAGNATFYYCLSEGSDCASQCIRVCITSHADPVANTWTQYPDLPMTFEAPDIVIAGGFINLFGGMGSFGASNVLLALSTTNPWSGWFEVQIDYAPSPRAGHRMVGFGGIIYSDWRVGRVKLFAGLLQRCVGAGRSKVRAKHVELLPQSYVISLRPLVQALRPVSPCAGLGAGHSERDGRPAAPRDVFSWDVHGYDLVMFGGFYHGVTNQQPDRYYNDVWFYRPAPIGLGGTNGIQPDPTASGWHQFQAVGPLPPARSGHASGILTDQLFVSGATSVSAVEPCCAGPTDPLCPMPRPRLLAVRPDLAVGHVGAQLQDAHVGAGDAHGGLPWRPALPQLARS